MLHLEIHQLCRRQAASATICDFIRSFASGFIFTTSLPPMVAAGALASVRHLKTSAVERERHQDRVARLRLRLDQAGVPHLRNESHIVPVMVGNAVLCRQISDTLIARYGIYLQPINYPTVPRGTERLRITPAPYHSDADIEHLVEALAEVWAEAREAFRTGASGLHKFSLTADEASEEGMVCGGMMEIFIDVWDGQQEASAT